MVTEIVIGLAVLALLIYRQLRTRPANASGLRIVAVIGVIGLVETYQFLEQHHAGAVAYAALLGSLALAAGFGVLQAATVRIVHLGYDAPGRRGRRGQRGRRHHRSLSRGQPGHPAAAVRAHPEIRPAGYAAPLKARHLQESPSRGRNWTPDGVPATGASALRQAA